MTTISNSAALLLFITMSLQMTSAFAWGSSSSFVGNSMSRSSTVCRHSPLTMDLELPSVVREKNLMTKFKLTIPGTSAATTIEVPRRSPTTRSHKEIDQMASIHGMPWTSSIDPSYEEQRITKDAGIPSSSSLFYMPFWEWQMDFMKQHLTNLRVLPVTNKAGLDLSYVENTERGMRMHTLQCASDEYKCIRMTVLDAGPRTQVFTSLWYPNPAYNLPVLGVDLLQFQQNKHLCVVDFQPIHESEAAHDQPYEHLMQPIREEYPSLQGKMTKKFYDEDSFFSKQMLLGRSDRDNAMEMVFQDLFPAYKSYVQTHVDLVRSTPAQYERIPEILKGHAAYDTYSAARDPAHGLLASAFGKEFADDYVYDILFPLSERL
jgi:15,16-dihydrobiliverdin:ferredoxin oxidoreductase